MFKRILVPLDGSATALQVLPYARVVAKAAQARLDLLQALAGYPRELVHQMTNEYVEGRPSYPPSTEVWASLQDHMRGDAEAYLNAVAEPLRGEGLQVKIKVTEDDPADAIVAEAGRAPDTLIAISTHGRSGVGRWMLGSVTDKVVRQAAHPTLIVRAHEGGSPASPRIRRVILPLDGTAMSRGALPYAVGLARSLGVGVTLLRSISPMSYGDSFAEYAPSMYEDLVVEIDTNVRDYLAQEAESVRALGVPDVDLHAAEGYAASAILDVAGDQGDTIVVMATHARSGVGRWVLGSVTDRVVRHSAGPVLVVPPATAKE